MTPRELYRDESSALADLRAALRDRNYAMQCVEFAITNETKARALVSYGDAELRLVQVRCALEALLLEDA
jgi:hypothetical protein